MAKKLTVLAVENAKPRPAKKGKNKGALVRTEIPDGGCAGLHLVVQLGGGKSWAFRYRRPGTGKPAKLTLGNGNMSLAMARKAAADALYEVSQGRDPAAARKAARARVEDAAGNTLRVIAEQWLTRKRELRSIEQDRRRLQSHVYPKLGGRPIGEVKRSEIARLLDHVEDTAGPNAADKVLGVIGRIMAWHASRDDEFRSPIVRGMARTKPRESARSRVLDDDELRRVWTAAETMPVFGQFIQFTLLCAARRNEAAHITDGELSNGDWVVPAGRYKSKIDHVVPLSGRAKAVLAKTPRMAGVPYIFSTGRRPLAAFSRYKRELDEASGVTGWRLHDLRRTARSLMSRAGVNADVAERALGHALPSMRGTYDRYEYHREKALAFEALAAQIERIVEPRDNVTPIRA